VDEVGGGEDGGPEGGAVGEGVGVQVLEGLTEVLISGDKVEVGDGRWEMGRYLEL
jgi:hypothetical protein